jgi:hypothetical protein
MTGVADKDPVCQTKYFGVKAVAKKAAAQKAVAASKEWASHVQGDLFLTHRTPNSLRGYKMADATQRAIRKQLSKLAHVSVEQVKLLNIHLPPSSAGYVTELTFSITLRRSSAQAVMRDFANIEHSQAFRDKFSRNLKALIVSKTLAAVSVSHVAFLDANPDTPSPTTYHFPTPVPTTHYPTPAPTTAIPTVYPTANPTEEPTRKEGELVAHVEATGDLDDFAQTKSPTSLPTAIPTLRTEDQLVVQVALLGEDIHNWWDGSLVRKKFRTGLAEATHTEEVLVNILGVHADPNVQLGVVVDTEVRVMKQRELTLIQSVETVKFASLLSRAFAKNAFDVPASKISVGVTFGDLSRVVVTEDRTSAGGAIPGESETSTFGMEEHLGGRHKNAPPLLGSETIRKLRFMLLAAGIVLMGTFGACSGVMWQTMRNQRNRPSPHGPGGGETIPLKRAQKVAAKQKHKAKPVPVTKSYFSSSPAKKAAPAPKQSALIGSSSAKAPTTNRSNTYDAYADDDDDDLSAFEFDDCMADDLGQEVI